MLKSLVGALVGSLTLAIVVPLAGLLLGWVEFDKGVLVVSGISAIGGAILGWVRPGIFLKTILFFIEPSIFD
jgi:hypothetical protein